MNENNKHTVLYVDDEESNLRIFKNTFRRDYNILTANSGEEGLDVLEKQKVDLILTDQRMPGMSGVDFLKRAIVKFPELNRIIITAYSDYDILREAVNDLKIFQYIEKPWRHDEIKVAIDSALEIYTLKMENQKLASVLMKQNDELNQINEELNEEIEKHKQTQIELIREKESAEKSNRLKSAFLANMSHEVRTPMNSIMGFMEILRDDDNPVTREESMQIIENSCNQLLHIINDIIEISKIDSGNVEVNKTRFSVNDTLRKIYTSFKITAKTGVNFELTNVLKEDNDLIFSDSIKLQQILSNLIDNAFKFTKKGNVELGAFRKDQLVMFYVKDTGVGIEEENHEIIFQRFRQVDLSTNRKYGGNGLGLAISKGYIESMGGKIWVESEIDKGAHFYFTVPNE